MNSATSLGLEHNRNLDHLMFEHSDATDAKLAVFEIDQANQTGL